MTAELRNTIYRYAVDQDDAVKLFHLTKKDIAEIGPRHMRLDCFGLLHTNQQIRSEFQGIYYEATTIQIPHYDLRAYLTTFRLHRKESFLWHGRLQIDLPQLGLRYYNAYHEATLLLRFREKHPNFIITVTRNVAFGEKEPVDNLIAAWKVLLQNSNINFWKQLRKGNITLVETCHTNSGIRRDRVEVRIVVKDLSEIDRTMFRSTGVFDGRDMNLRWDTPPSCQA